MTSEYVLRTLVVDRIKTLADARTDILCATENNRILRGAKDDPGKKVSCV